MDLQMRSYYPQCKYPAPTTCIYTLSVAQPHVKTPFDMSSRSIRDIHKFYCEST